MKHSLKIIIACLLVALCVLPFFACGDNSAAYDDSALESKLTELNDKITDLETKISDSQGNIAALEKELKEAKAKLLLLEGKVDGDPNKVYKMGETVSYSSNGLKLFEITVTGIGSETQKSTWVSFDFTPYAFYPEKNLGNSIGAVLVDNSSQSKTTNESQISGTTKNFVFPTFNNGKKTLYVSICSANMNIPFAVYELTLSVSN